jgi:hypothetical protein
MRSLLSGWIGTAPIGDNISGMATASINNKAERINEPFGCFFVNENINPFLLFSIKIYYTTV